MKNFNTESRKITGMPMQAMPIERHLTGTAAVAADAGAEASAWWDTLLHVAKTALPIASQIAGSL